MSSRAEEVARAVLYEGYILYPYRPSSVKNQQRWNFGVIYPPCSPEGESAIETQCLVALPSSDARPEVDIEVRFLHLVERSVACRDEGAESFHSVPKAECDGRLYQTWQEAVERQVRLERFLLDEAVAQPFSFPAQQSTEAVRDSAGCVRVRIIREQQALEAVVKASAEPVAPNHVRLSVRISNLTERPADASRRDSLLLGSLVSVHTILTVRGAEFVSLIDPPPESKDAAESCRNLGTFPVLAGGEGQRNVMLSSPIILYDYPQVSPESAGDLCDATEIDEILSLRILTLTEEEKREMRQSDPRASSILERTESLPEEQWMKLHGVLRGLRPTTEISQ